MALVYHGPEAGRSFSDVAGNHHPLCSDFNRHHIQEYLDSRGYHRQASRSSPLVLADFGTGDGVLALATFMPVIESMTKADEDNDVLILINDLAENDWKRVYQNIKASRINEKQGLTVLHSANDFHKPCAPAGFIDFAMSNLANMSFKDVMIEKELFLTCNDVTPEEYQKWASKFAENWRTFLTRRSRELKSGGRLSCTFMMKGSYDGGRYLQLMSDVWTDMYSEGSITQDEFRNTIVKSCYVSKSDVMAPFVDGEFCGLKIVTYITKRLRVDWADNDSVHTVYPEKMTNLLQSWTRVSMATILAETTNPRSREDIEVLLDWFYIRVKEKLAQSVITFASTPFTFGLLLLQKCQ